MFYKNLSNQRFLGPCCSSPVVFCLVAALPIIPPPRNIWRPARPTSKFVPSQLLLFQLQHVGVVSATELTECYFDSLHQDLLDLHPISMSGINGLVVLLGKSEPETIGFSHESHGAFNFPNKTNPLSACSKMRQRWSEKYWIWKMGLKSHQFVGCACSLNLAHVGWRVEHV